MRRGRASSTRAGAWSGCSAGRSPARRRSRPTTWACWASRSRAPRAASGRSGCSSPPRRRARRTPSTCWGTVSSSMYLDSPDTEEFSGEKREAARLLTQAATQGHGRAQVLAGKVHMFGIGVEKDEPKAVEFITLAAESGTKEGQYLMGSMLLEGRVVQWFEKAALQGHQNAQYNLSQMLATGDGIEMDRSVHAPRRSRPLGPALAVQQGNQRKLVLLACVLRALKRSGFVPLAANPSELVPGKLRAQNPSWLALSAYAAFA
ncbi:unnamed protein product [Prorocentrum cordatum]|uniref:Sel1 repeat family protein n=1 Tax=Prorocentrum cordatum TaxID=2364126 RepID=A0ABN9UAM3_9DINO|nr:unnamed protein product [Polarella glacialis]